MGRCGDRNLERLPCIGRVALAAQGLDQGIKRDPVVRRGSGGAAQQRQCAAGVARHEPQLARIAQQVRRHGIVDRHAAFDDLGRFGIAPLAAYHVR